MPRKKKETAVEPSNSPEKVAQNATTPVSVEATPQTVEPTVAQPDEHNPRRPAVSWKYPAAAGVLLEVALWPHTITLQSGEKIEVYNATITRSYRDQGGQWQRGGSFRIAEIPVLIHALLRAHGYALDAREQTCPL